MREDVRVLFRASQNTEQRPILSLQMTRAHVAAIATPTAGRERVQWVEFNVHSTHTHNGSLSFRKRVFPGNQLHCQEPSDNCWKHTFSLPISKFSALWVSHVMRYINLRYLLTYLLTYLFTYLLTSRDSRDVHVRRLWQDHTHDFTISGLMIVRTRVILLLYNNNNNNNNNIVIIIIIIIIIFLLRRSSKTAPEHKRNTYNASKSSTQK